jgi:class 3 adenylate cyclase
MPPLIFTVSIVDESRWPIRPTRLRSTALATGRVERRLAAILAADVEGYSRPWADEEGTHLRLKAHFGQLVYPKINTHGGRIVKNTGNVLLAEFPSVLGAVRCAVGSNSARSRLV